MTIRDAFELASKEGKSIMRTSWETARIDLLYRSKISPQMFGLYHEGILWRPEVEDLLAEDWTVAARRSRMEPKKQAVVDEENLSFDR